MFRQLYPQVVGAVARRIIDSKPTLNILHIGKTGGTNLLEAGIGIARFNDQVKFKLREKIFWKYRTTVIGHDAVPNSLSYPNLALFIRDPLLRYESAFWYEKNWASSEYAHVIPQDSDVAYLFGKFLTFEDWLRALTDTEDSKHQDACQLKTKGYHLHRDYAFYFKNSANVEKMKSNLVFVGETEHYSDDLKRLCKIIGIKNATPLTYRRNSSDQKKKTRIRPAENDFYRGFFAKEYLIYNKIRGLKSCHD